MKMNLQNGNIPPNPNLIKWLAAITLATTSMPVWLSEIPLEISDTTKAMIEWSFKGVNVLLSIVAVFTKVNPESLSKYYDKEDIQTAAESYEEEKLID